MARYDRLTVYNVMIENGLIPLFFNQDIEKAKKIADSLYYGGARILEFTNRGESALTVFSQLQSYCNKNHPGLIIGAGSIIDAPTAALFIAQGANFIVGPSFDKEVALLCNKRKIVYIPGAATVNEIQNAEELGIEIIKIFPGSTIGGPKFIKSILGPMPWVRLMPTGGVTSEEDNIKSWFDGGAICIGMGSQLIKKEWLAAGEYNKIKGLTNHVLSIIKSVRNK